MTVPSKRNVPSLSSWPLTYEGFFQWIAYNPISILYKFQIDISSNSREIKYQNIGRTHRHTHRHTHRQTGWKQYLATPSGGEVITETGWKDAGTFLQFFWLTPCSIFNIWIDQENNQHIKIILILCKNLTGYLLIYRIIPYSLYF